MTIELPDVRVDGKPLDEPAARLDFATGLYTGRHATAGQAAMVAGLTKVLFLQEMDRRGIAMHYSVGDFEHDMRVLDELAGKNPA